MNNLNIKLKFMTINQFTIFIDLDVLENYFLYTRSGVVYEIKLTK